MPPDVTLTPVGGDPWNGGAQEFDPVTAPPLTVSLAQPTNTDGNALRRNDEMPAASTPAAQALAPVVQSLGSGHAYDDYARYLDPSGGYQPGMASPPALVARAADAIHGAVTDPAAAAKGAAAAAVAPAIDGYRWTGDVLSGRMGEPTDPSFPARAAPGAAAVVGAMGMGGLGRAALAGEVADGSVAGMFAGGRSDAHQLTAIQKAMDALVRPGRPTAPAATAAAPMSLQDQMAALLRGDDIGAAAPLEAPAAPMHPRALPADQLAQSVPDGHFQAFHGSPALFDRFSMDHLGTGEGAQAYGHGMYFAGDQNVGAFYADAYGQPRTLPDGSTVNGHMYQVAIPGHPDQFFNQDLSLAEQSPAVRAAVAPLYEANGVAPDYRGGNLLYEMKQNALQSGVPYRDVDRHVSRQFQDAGILGHSYSGGGDAPNYVVFDPSGVRTLKTYATGVPVPGAAPTDDVPQPVTRAQALAAMLRAGAGR